jgi:hypothetical protein
MATADSWMHRLTYPTGCGDKSRRATCLCNRDEQVKRAFESMKLAKLAGSGADFSDSETENGEVEKDCLVI